MADPSSCNAGNNGLEVYDSATQAFIIKIEDATHCHFEFPLDKKCTFVCGRGEKRHTHRDIQQVILGLTTAYLLWQTGIDLTAKNWWTVDSNNHQILVNAGFITRIK